jgi:hypothetical protein
MSDFNGLVLSLTDEQKEKLREALGMPPITPSGVGLPIAQEIAGVKQPKTSKGSVTIDDKFHVQQADANSKRKQPVKAKKNEWVDNGEHRDIETKYGERTPRREPQKKVEVDCSVCGRSFKVDPKFVYGEYHRCGRCVGKAR